MSSPVNCFFWYFDFIDPVVLHTGIIIPLLKTQTYTPHDTGSYRPITLSSTFYKLL